MKKNFFFGLFALATMMVTSSCSEQELVDPSLLNGDVVTFTVNLQQSASTRAALAGRGTLADKLYYGVYEKTSNNGWALIPAISALTGDYNNDKDPATIQYGTSTQVEIKLAKQKEYSVIFWAANAENNMGMDKNDLYVAECFADGGQMLKRMQPVSKGRGHAILKRTSHITVILDVKKLEGEDK